MAGRGAMLTMMVGRKDDVINVIIAGCQPQIPFYESPTCGLCTGFKMVSNIGVKGLSMYRGKHVHMYM